MTRLFALHGDDDPISFDSYGRTLSARALRVRIASLAARLPDAAKGAPAVIACADRAHFASAFLAVLSRGYTVALPPNGQPETVHSLAERIGALALLHDRDDGRGIDVRQLLENESQAPASPEFDARARVLLFTSGSTAAPKPHRKTLAQLLAEVSALTSAFAFEKPRIVSLVPPQHIYGLLFGVLVPLTTGGSFSCHSPLQPAEVLAQLRLAHADTLVAVPPHLAALSAFTSDEAWPALSRVFSSGAPLPRAVALALSARWSRVHEILGSTETGGIATRCHPDDAWQPLPNVTIDVGSEGALLVDSPWLGDDAQRPLRTQDRVERTAGGFLHLGRADSVIKIGGLRIDATAIEQRLRECEGVRDARVIALSSDGLRGVELGAVVEGEGLEASALRKELARHFDPVTIPRRFRIVARLPRGAAGKVSLSALEALFDRWHFEKEEQPDGRVRITIPKDSPCFRGHFDGHPVLPGVVQLKALALDSIRERFPDLGALTRMTRVKLKRVVVPEEQLVLTLERTRASMVVFTLHVAEEVASTGIFHFAVAEP